MGLTRPKNATLEVKVSVEKDVHHLLLCCHLCVFREFSLNFIPMMEDIKVHTKDNDKIYGDSILPWKAHVQNGYVRINHKVCSATTGLCMIQQLSDYLVNQGWEMMAMAIGSNDTVVEKWIKKGKVSTEEPGNEEQVPN